MRKRTDLDEVGRPVAETPGRRSAPHRAGRRELRYGSCMHRTEVILYVEDQDRAASFYRRVLGASPALDAPGMTEFDLEDLTLGLVPERDSVARVPGITPGTGQRCEIYLRRRDAAAALERVEPAGGRVLAPLSGRPWGESVGYALDPDGHVLALAEVGPDTGGGPAGA
ncbi:hypothetical protein AIF0345_0384 [Actinomyces israelii]|nr:hypothetical protein AIF0345_0384 [Actinomyces israelii]